MIGRFADMGVVLEARDAWLGAPEATREQRVLHHRIREVHQINATWTSERGPCQLQAWGKTYEEALGPLMDAIGRAD